MGSILAALAVLCIAAATCSAQAPQADGAGLERGALPDHWAIGGPHCMEMQDFYVHEYNPNFYILRQSGCSDYEKPFVYLIFGSDKLCSGYRSPERAHQRNRRPRDRAPAEDERSARNSARHRASASSQLRIYEMAGRDSDL